MARVPDWRRIPVLVPVTLLLAADAHAQTTRSGRDASEKIDEYLRVATESGLFMGTVLVADNNRVVIDKGYGLANLEHDVPNTPQTRFDIASVSKTFTAALVLRLQEQGNLSVQDRLCKYLADCPDAWSAVTIHHLLSHTSGITSYTDLPDQFERRPLESFVPDALAQIRKMPLQFAPGERFSYSNTGYKLLDQVIERVVGKSHSEALQEYILDPAKMANTGFLQEPGVRHRIVKNLADGYTDGIGPLERAPWVYPSYGGGLYSTSDDMLAWGRALLSGRLLSKKSLDLAFSPVKGNYGYGWFAIDSGTHHFVMHGGNIPGFGITFALYPADGLVIFVASNLDTAPTSRIHDDLARMVFGERYDLLPRWKEVTVDPHIYRRYVGRYRNKEKPDFVVTITEKSGRLWNRLDDSPGAATMVLRPLSETKYFNKMFVLYETTFVKDAGGQVTGLVSDGPWGHSEFQKVE